MRARLSGLVLLLVVALVRPAVAQTGRPAAPPAPQARTTKPPPKPKVGIQASFLVEREMMAASKSFEATVGTGSFTALGGVLDVRHVWRDAFARVSFSTTSQSGSRAYAFNGTVIPLGIPLDVRLTHVEIGGGWRFRTKQWKRGEFYAGAGLVLAMYREESQFALADENTSQTFNGSMIFAGLDAVVWKWVTAGAEVSFRSVPNALGSGGLSQEYGERSLGGTALRVLIGVRRQR